jgi:K+-transporting ATPase ATPase A chain
VEVFRVAGVSFIGSPNLALVLLSSLRLPRFAVVAWRDPPFPQSPREATLMSLYLFPLLVVAVSVALSVPVGHYLAWVMDGRYTAPAPLRWIEARLDTGPQTWKGYTVALLAFNLVLIVVGYVVLALQPVLPLNPEGKGMLAHSTIFHTVLSFVTNNSQQHYAGEVHLSYFSQLTVIVGNMFLGGGVSLCALSAVVRGLRGDAHLGNFYLDLWRSVVYVLVPASLILGVLLLAAGVPMTFEGPARAPAGPIARGPVAALVPIKNLASVGGGFFAGNSAHPYENPSGWTNFLSCVAILLFPCAVIVQFGRMLGRMRHAVVLYGVMMALLLGLTAWVSWFDAVQPNPGMLARAEWARQRDGIALPALAELPVDQDGTGNLEGKELRFGREGSATFVADTTAVACGSVNCMHDSLNPLAQLGPLAGMWLNCVFGGKGVGLVNLLLVLIVTVFLTGLMVGRTPEYLGKKVEAHEMKLAMLALLVHPLLILVPTALFATRGWVSESASNPGPHGFTQSLYEFTSAAAGNGSGLEGLGDTWGFADARKNPTPPAPYSTHWDIAAGLVMVLCRFLPIVAALALAGGLAVKPALPFTVGTLRTDTFLFAVVLLFMIVLLGALAFLPAAALGPAAEHFGPIPFGR